MTTPALWPWLLAGNVGTAGSWRPVAAGVQQVDHSAVDIVMTVPAIPPRLVGGILSRWLRARLQTSIPRLGVPADDGDRLRVGGVPPDAMTANDERVAVARAFAAFVTSKKLLVRCDEAFSKPGARAALTVALAASGRGRRRPADPVAVVRRRPLAGARRIVTCGRHGFRGGRRWDPGVHPCGRHRLHRAPRLEAPGGRGRAVDARRGDRRQLRIHAAHGVVADGGLRLAAPTAGEPRRQRHRLPRRPADRRGVRRRRAGRPDEGLLAVRPTAGARRDAVPRVRRRVHAGARRGATGVRADDAACQRVREQRAAVRASQSTTWRWRGSTTTQPPARGRRSPDCSMGPRTS